jgi:nucleotide-binding universal stress UspA family protein
MAGFRRILCATDLSDGADWAIRAADREARLHGAELLLLHVVPMRYPGSPMTPATVEQALLRQEELSSGIIDNLLERAERLTGRDAGTVSVIVEEGNPEETIIAQSDAFAIDLIVVGSHGAGNRRRLFGGVAEKVVKHANVPVLVARPGPETGRILVATDFSGPAEPAIQLAAEEAVRRCASLVAVHSLEPIAPEVAMGDPPVLMPLAVAAYPLEEMREIARKRLTDTLSDVGVSGEVEVVQGPPSVTILQAAEKNHVDLVVIGTSGLTGIDRLLLGSVATKVVRDATCSVLVARPPRPVRQPAPPLYQPAATV